MRRARPGDVLRIEGAGFGARSDRVRVRFDATEVSPYAQPFSDTTLLVTAPLPPAATKTVSVRVARQVSNEVPMRVVRPRPPRGQTGDATIEYFQLLDQYGALVATTARRLSIETPFEREMHEGAEMLDGCRRAMQRNVELLMQWRDAQSTRLARAAPIEALRTIERLDELVVTADLTTRATSLLDLTFGPAGLVARETGRALGAALFDSDFDPASFGAGLIDGLGGLLHEGTKLIEGVEQLFKIVVPSFEIGGTGGIAVANAVVLVDVSISIGEGITAFAKLIDFVAQYLDSLADFLRGDPVGEKLDRLEAKADRLSGNVRVISENVIRFFQETAARLDRAEQKLDRLEAKADRDTEKLDRLESKADRQEQKHDRLEAKADRDTEKLDMLETKADRQEQKLDRLEAKADRDTEKLDMLEAKSDRQEGKLDRQEQKLDRQEEKLDRLEGKADRQEGKLDRQEQKLDRGEGKLDRLEGKADRQEGKLDRLEGKADRQEGKLDRIEVKLDVIEPKLDRLEAKADRFPVFAPHEGAVAAQRAGGTNVTAVVAATRAGDDRVHLRAAVDVAPDTLDEEAAWSLWMDFARPQNAAAILEASVSASYAEASNTVLDALLSIRDATGRVFHRAFEAQPQDRLLTPAAWTDWRSFLAQP